MRIEPLHRGFQIQPRDIALLRGLFECRYLTLSHLADQYFEGRREMAKKRIQRLKQSKLIAAHNRGVGVAELLRLSPHGIRFLEKSGHLSQYPALPGVVLSRRTRIRPLTIDHELAVADVKSAFCRAVRGRNGTALVEFGTWPRLYEFSIGGSLGVRGRVAPDGFVRLRDAHGDEVRFFVEVDRSTEATAVLVSRVAQYRRFYRSGRFAMRMGKSRNDFASYPFRVLIVCKSRERCASLAAALLAAHPSTRAFALLATSDDVERDALGCVWHAPADDHATPTRSLLS